MRGHASAPFSILNKTPSSVRRNDERVLFVVNVEMVISVIYVVWVLQKRLFFLIVATTNRDTILAT